MLKGQNEILSEIQMPDNVAEKTDMVCGHPQGFPRKAAKLAGNSRWHNSR